MRSDIEQVAVQLVSEAIQKLGGKAAVARATGIPVRSLQNWELGVSAPRFDAVMNILRHAAAAGHPITLPDWLDGSYRRSTADSRNDAPSEAVLVRRFDVSLSAGDGSFSDRAEPRSAVPFAVEFFTRRLNDRKPENMVIVDARGDGMAPTIADGDLVMIDTSDKSRREGIYAVALGGELYVKRLTASLDGFTMVSDNHDYPPVVLSNHQLLELAIIGRVVWVGHNL